MNIYWFFIGYDKKCWTEKKTRRNFLLCAKPLQNITTNNEVNDEFAGY